MDNFWHSYFLLDYTVKYTYYPHYRPLHIQSGCQYIYHSSTDLFWVIHIEPIPNRTLNLPKNEIVMVFTYKPVKSQIKSVQSRTNPNRTRTNPFKSVRNSYKYVQNPLKLVHPKLPKNEIVMWLIRILRLNLCSLHWESVLANPESLVGQHVRLPRAMTLSRTISSFLRLVLGWFWWTNY